MNNTEPTAIKCEHCGEDHCITRTETETGMFRGHMSVAVFAYCTKIQREISAWVGQSAVRQ